MELRFFQVDVFTKRLFGGNPAGVIPLDRWLDDVVMQRIARENNLSETAFFVSEGNHYGLRWFTPTVEVSLCGHGTLASAFVLFNELEPGRTEVCFETLSGLLSVAQDGEGAWRDARVRRRFLEANESGPSILHGSAGGRPRITLESRLGLQSKKLFPSHRRNIHVLLI